MNICLTRGILVLVCLLLTACSTHSGMSEELARSVKDFNKLLRWHEIDKAGAAYIAPELREEFLKQADTLKKRGLSVTDFRILSTRYIPEKKSGDVVAEFDYFVLPSNRVKTIAYRQEWVYFEKSDSWKLKSGLPLFE